VPLVLGGGANLIVADGPLEETVLATERMARVFRPAHGAGAEGQLGASSCVESPALAASPARGEPLERVADARLVAWAGASLPGLVRAARDLGWSGLEGLVGVPGHLGGAVAMNAGGRWGEMWDVVERVRVLLGDGTLIERARADGAARYRDANLGGAIVLGAVLRLRVDAPAAVHERMREYLAHKSAAQPVTERSAGCIFKNPPHEAAAGLSAGQLVERCGLKGRARGAAEISHKHGNFIVNRGGATAVDVLGLVEEVRAEVAERTGVLLEREVKVWGRTAR
jgi:UDP-N-acetylmuramate dehydrogenase